MESKISLKVVFAVALLKQKKEKNMKNIIYIILFILLLFKTLASSEDAVVEKVEVNNHIEQNDRASSINIDMQIVYGYQYNDILSTINLSQEGENFVYLLSSYLMRSNDFGYNDTKYENSSFYENRIGFTGNFNILDKWKLILDAEVDNESRGMFTDDVVDDFRYNHEEKDMDKLSIKNIYRITTSFEMFISLGSAGAVHRLRAVGPSGGEKSKLNQVNLEAGGEYIWSAYNRIRFNSVISSYKYSDEDVPNDRYFDCEVIDDINLTGNIGISIGMGYDMNKDQEAVLYPLPIFGVSLKGFKYFSSYFIYRYDIVPFKPEEYYLAQKYIKPAYNLPPGKVHHGSLKVEYRMNSKINMKGKMLIEKNNNFYNYYTIDGDVLSAEAVSVIHYNTKIDANFLFYKRILEFAFSFEYSYYDSDKNITYHPSRKFSNTIKYNAKKWKLEWSNEFISKVYTDPEDEKKLDEMMIGYFGVQRQMHNGFYAYIRIENLYNNKYNIREDYPEPGFLLLGGLRILI